MNITQQQREFIENIIKECRGYAGNEGLLGDFYEEAVLRAVSLISGQEDLNSVTPYLKRIANASIVEVLKRPKSVENLDIIENLDGFENQVIDQELIQEATEVNSEVDINYDFEASNDRIILDESRLNQIKNIISNLDVGTDSSFHKDIFELRYIHGFNNAQIAEKLDIKPENVDKDLLFMLNMVKEECFSA